MSRAVSRADGVPVTTDPPALPPGRQLVVTWWIPEEYGGQTTATLRRVSEQARRSGRPVEVLTFAGMWDTREAAERLRGRGALGPGVVLRNLWEDLRTWESTGALHDRLGTLPQVEAVPEITALETSHDRGPYGVRSYDENEELFRADTYRLDGTLLCHEAPVFVDGRKRRYQQFFRPDGSSSVLLGSAWDVYYLWLDDVIGDDPAIIVNESKSTARFMSRYTNPRATLIHQFHESHLAQEMGDDPYKGELRQAHRWLMPHLDRFDGVVFLTEQQRRDVVERFGGGANLHSVPNAGPRPLELPHKRFDPSRRGGRGIVVATLKPLKRLEHAVRAIAGVRSAGQAVTLDIYGRDAGSRAVIEQAIAETGTRDAITLHGYTAHAAQHFADASFSLMTSLTEGQSLVLLESMAAGCVPISYDIRYGPSELLVDGETGFLVPAGDLTALVETIRRFVRLPSRELRRLRAQCQERLAGFDDAEIFQRWIAVQRAAITRSARRLSLTAMSVDTFEIVAEGESLAVRARVTADWDASRWTAQDDPLPTANLLVAGRRRGAPQRLPMDIEPVDRSAPPSRFRASILLDPRKVEVGEPVGDVYLELECEATARQARLRGAVEAAVPAAEVFATSYGNVSLRRL